MRDLLLQAQAWWDIQRFDQSTWQVATWQDQKVRHIQLHVAKALGKVIAALGVAGEEAPSLEALARVREEVLPDVAIYRSQLINLFPDCAAPTLLQKTALATVAATSQVVQQPGGAHDAPGFSHVVHALGLASAHLAAYLEPREHGTASPITHISTATQHLHACAVALAAAFGVSLVDAHQARLEALLGHPLPEDLVERAVAYDPSTLASSRGGSPATRC